MSSQRVGSGVVRARLGAGAIACVAGVVSLALVATSCTSNANDAVRNAAEALTPMKNVMDLAALPSDPPKRGFERGGGGLAGGVFTVWGMPGARGGKDRGIVAGQMRFSRSGGVRTKLTWLAGKAPYKFVVRDEGAGTEIWNSGDAATNAACTINADEASCTVPAGVLRVDGTYRVSVSAGGVQEQRMFTVADLPTASGAATASLKGRGITTGRGSVGLGMQFSTADQGVTADSANSAGFSAGLPPGWHFAGLPGGIAHMKIAEANGYADYSKILTVEAGGSPAVLGCKAESSAGEICGSMAGSLVGEGYSAIIPPGTGDIVLTESGDQNWRFDSRGRVTEYTANGDLPTRFEYREGSDGLLSRVDFGGLIWNLYYPGDKDSAGQDRCPQLEMPPGFTDNPADYLCEVDSPLSESVRILYTKPVGADKPRLSRAIGMPNECFGDVRGCPQSRLQIVDFGWDSLNRPFLQRDDLNTLGVLAGSLQTGANPIDDPTLVKMSYDDGTGRLASSTLPADHPGAVRQVSEYGYREFDIDRKFAPATRTIETTTRLVDGSVPAMTKIRAFDEALRGVHAQEPTGELQSTIWHPLKVGMQLGETDGQTTSATEYDFQGNPVGTYQGPASAFSSEGCRADAPRRDDRSCVPTDPDRVSSTFATFDQPEALGPAGLTRRYYQQPDFSGTARVDLAQYDSGFEVLPSGVSAGKFATRFTGGLLLPKKKLSMTVMVPDGGIEGTLWLAGSPCGVITDKVVKCVYNNSPKSLGSSDVPVSVRLDLNRTSSGPLVSGKIIYRIEDLVGGGVVPLNGRIISRVGAMTTARSVDFVPSTGEKATTIAHMRYENVSVAQPTSTRMSGSNDQPGAAQVDLKPTAFEFEPDGVGTQRLKSSTSGAQVNWRHEYWGFDETPRQAGLANLDQLPEAIKDQRQMGLTKAVTDPSGRQTTVVYDPIGAVACTQRTSAGPNWTCVYRDGDYREVGSVERGNDGEPEVVTRRSYELGRAPGDAFMTTTLETAIDGRLMKEVSKTSSSLGLLEYTDWLGTNTTYYPDAFGETTKMVIAPTGTPKDAPAGSSFNPKVISVERDALRYPTVYKVDGEEMAAISYSDSTHGRDVKEIKYSPGLSMTPMNDGMAQGEMGQTWTLGGKKKVVVNKVWASQAGIIMKEEFGGRTVSYLYDSVRRLQKATIDGSDFTYGWDNDGQRVCAAANIANADSKPCERLNGAVKYEYDHTRPVRTTDPLAAIPVDGAYNRAGSLRAVGNTTFDYDARQLLSLTRNDSGEQVEYVRDGFGRVSEARGKLLEAVKPSGAPSDSASPSPAVPPVAGTAEGELGVPPAEPSPTAVSPSPPGEPSPLGTPTGGASPTVTQPVKELRDSTVRYGFSSPTGAASVRYEDGENPALMMGLPGGVYLMAGCVWMIPSTTGNGWIPVYMDGTSDPPTFSGPYGEAVGAEAGSDRGGLTDAITDMGQRTYNRDLGTFLQSDPSMYGSPAGQYSYTSSDPVNYDDPTGTTVERKESKLPGWARTLVRAAGQIAFYMTASLLSDKIIKTAWFTKLGSGMQKGVMFAVYSGSSVIATFLAELVVNLANLDQVTSWEWAAMGFLSFIMGGLGSASFSVEKAITTEVSTLNKGFTDLGTALTEKMSGVSTGLTEFMEKMSGSFANLLDKTSNSIEKVGKSVAAEVPEFSKAIASLGEKIAGVGDRAVGLGVGNQLGTMVATFLGVPGAAPALRAGFGALGGLIGPTKIKNFVRNLMIGDKKGKGPLVFEASEFEVIGGSHISGEAASIIKGGSVLKKGVGSSSTAQRASVMLDSNEFIPLGVQPGSLLNKGQTWLEKVYSKDDMFMYETRILDKQGGKAGKVDIDPDINVG